MESSASPLSSPFRKREKKKLGESSLGPLKEPPKCKKNVGSVEEFELVVVQFPPSLSICSGPDSFSQVFPQLVFKNDVAQFEKLGDVGT